MDPSSLPTLLLIAWLLPLVSFAAICCWYSLLQFMGHAITPGTSKPAAIVACIAIISGFVMSVLAVIVWQTSAPTGDDLAADPAAAHAALEPAVPPGRASSTRPVSSIGADPSTGPVLSTGPNRRVQFAAWAEPVQSDTPAAADGEAAYGPDAQGPDAQGPDAQGHAARGHDAQGHAARGHDDHGHPAPPPRYYSGDWYTLASFGKLKLTIGYHIDALTIAMFAMVTLIASCIHLYAIGYMHDELHEGGFVDHEVTLRDGEHLKRHGRFHRFFQYMSLFCFSMLGLVVAGNILMVFVFWELVGICSYFLIGFYIERKSATNAANKAFIVNRIGDFGMIIGLMALWGSLGTFAFGDRVDEQGNIVEQGIFSQLRSPENDYQLEPADGMVEFAAQQQVAAIVAEYPGDLALAGREVDAHIDEWRNDEEHRYGYGLLVLAGVGIFCGCVGKSAQFPLHVWLPDAMEGPTPVSALVHSATMVAAGVYLVGRFYPVFTPEVLLVIAVIGCITLFMAATIAITATDIKRVLAYSTLSQLGYMMFALGIGGWLAGMLHLITHAFFKSLLFLCSGSVIHAVHTNEMPKMGGLIRKMPITGWTMFVGCLAISGAGIPLVIGLSGYYSKDSIIAQAINFQQNNATWGAMFFVAAGGAAITAFYMFRLWFMTFLGTPRDPHCYEHAHESPNVMTWPLLILSFFAIFVATPPITTLLDPLSAPLVTLLEEARPAGTGVMVSGLLHPVTIPHEHASHSEEIHFAAGITAFMTALAGVLLASAIYWWRLLDAREISDQFPRTYRFLRHKWWFDELYEIVFVRPTLFVARRISQIDRDVIDWLIDRLAGVTKGFARLWDAVIDRGVVDGGLNTIASRTWKLGTSLHALQTGRIRQYVMFIAIATVALFITATLVWRYATAG